MAQKQIKYTLRPWNHPLRIASLAMAAFMFVVSCIYLF